KECGAGITTANPLLGSLANNGGSGSTQTLALLAGSPAINAGNNSVCPKTDQRGVARPQGGVCDIGAFEAK
ncbi:MAG TPA: choice-of-anchor Q domain-containing protein, partial [Coleofasciculaceae cyanobacterium]